MDPFFAYFVLVAGLTLQKPQEAEGGLSSWTYSNNHDINASVTCKVLWGICRIFGPGIE